MKSQHYVIFAQNEYKQQYITVRYFIAYVLL